MMDGCNNNLLLFSFFVLTIVSFFLYFILFYIHHFSLDFLHWRSIVTVGNCVLYHFLFTFFEKQCCLFVVFYVFLFVFYNTNIVTPNYAYYYKYLVLQVHAPYTVRRQNLGDFRIYARDFSKKKNGIVFIATHDTKHLKIGKKNTIR